MHPDHGYELNGMAKAQLGLGNARDAVTLFRQVLKLWKKIEMDPCDLAEVWFDLARALWAGDGDRTEARELASRSRKTFEEGQRAKQAREVAGWLARHPTDRSTIKDRGL